MVAFGEIQFPWICRTNAAMIFIPNPCEYVGLDVSQKETSVCVVDQAGRSVYQG